MERGVEDFLQLGARFVLPPFVQQQLREEEMRRGAVRVVLQRRPQVIFSLLAPAAEQPWHPEVPTAQRAVGGAVQERRVEAQHGFQFFFDRLAILQALHAERLGERAHVRREPEVPFGTIRLRRHRLAPGVDPLFERRAPLALRHVAAEPVIGARELPRRAEILRIGAQRSGPDLGGAPRAGQVRAVRVQRVGGLRRQQRDIE